MSVFVCVGWCVAVAVAVSAQDARQYRNASPGLMQNCPQCGVCIKIMHRRRSVLTQRVLTQK